MKRMIFFFIFTMLTCSAIFSQQWKVYPSGADNINSIDFADSNTGWFAGDGLKLYFWDHDNSRWLQSGLNNPWLHYQDVKVFDANTIYAIGGQGFFKTTNGGHHAEDWTKYWFNHEVYGMYFMDKDTGLVVGNLGTILRTTDAGATWTKLPVINANAYYSAIQITASGFGIATYGHDMEIQTTDFGRTWTTITNIPIHSNYISNSITISKQNIIIVGASIDGYVVLTSHNKGQSWTAVSLPSTTWNELFDVWLSDSTAITVGENGVIYKSTDAGDTWTKQTSPTTNTLRSIVVLPSGHCWIAGAGGFTAQCIDMLVGIESNINDPPNSLSLAQNYPNPFNPITTISYALPQESHVQLVIYNQLGQQLATLVSISQSAGTYSVQWSPADLPSGIYFYRLQVNKSMIIKKMMYLK